MVNQAQDQMERLEKWYSALPEAAKDVGQEAATYSTLVDDTYANKVEQFNAAKYLVIQLINNPRLAKSLGGPVEGWIGDSADYYSNWNAAATGRRCRHSLQAIANGLRKYNSEDDEELMQIVNDISRIVDLMKPAFSVQRGKDNTVIRSLREDHGIINFHLTHLDPVLFSTLAVLRSIEDDYLKDRRDTIEYEEAGIRDESEFYELKGLLIDLIRQEVSKYTPKGIVRSNLIADESTLWWGVYELVKFHKRSDTEEFYVHKDSEDLRGMSGAARLIERLIGWTTTNPAYPDFFRSLYEVTLEIHCPLRTQLWIVNTALNLYEFEWPEGNEQKIKSSLEELISWSLKEAMISWNNNPELQTHAYFIGLALETLCHCQTVFGGLGEIEVTNFHQQEKNNQVDEVERLEDDPENLVFEGEKRYIMWRHGRGIQSLTPLTQTLEEKRRRMSFDVEIDEYSDGGVIKINKGPRKDEKPIKIYRDTTQTQLSMLWLLLTSMEKGFGEFDIENKVRKGKKRLRDDSGYRHCVDSLREFLGKPFGDEVLPRKSTKYFPGEFSWCWILTTTDVNKSLLIDYPSSSPPENANG